MSTTKSFSFTEDDLDTVFIGQLDLHHVDDYGSVKAGTHSRTAVVRSVVDRKVGVITLIVYLAERYGVTNVLMDGSHGIYGKISERCLNNKGELTRADLLYLRLLPAKTIAKESIMTEDHLVWLGQAEIDDLVFDLEKKYVYDVYYFARKIGKGSPILSGLQIDIPIEDFNLYVKMRNLWFRDYQGSKIIDF